ncbi:MAG: response regulator transcription factor [Dehalococcoidales bacterium]|nr:response regulator transcription factor [Dehalococcoidales bacterium]
MRVLIVDDHALFRSGLASLLTANDIEVVGEASNGLEAVEKTRQLRPDIVLMDVKMADFNGIQATQLIKAEMPQTKIVMVTAFEDDDDLFEAMKGGAVGYILKNIEAEKFVKFLSNIMEGDVAVSPWVADKIVKEAFRQNGRLRSSQPANDLTNLTNKEAEVLKLVATGATNKEIASSLNISENTVKYHLRNIMEKLHVRNRAQMVARAVTRGIVPGSAGGKTD